MQHPSPPLPPAPPARAAAPLAPSVLHPRLPLHQHAAINDFFTRLQHAQTENEECSTCHESFPGIHVTATQCDQCAREVRTLLVIFPMLTPLQHGIHCFSAQNSADPGIIPPDLCEILAGLTQMEEMLCSLASPCFLMWVSKGGQYKSRGNVITFPQDLAPLCTTLPRLPEELDVLLVRKPDARDPVAYKDFHVQKHKVLALLYYLRAHNPFYQTVVIRPPADINLPDDASIFSCLRSTPAQSYSESLHPDAPTDEGEPAPDELAQEPNSFIPSIGPASSEEHAISSNMRASGLAHQQDEPLPWPDMGPPLSEYTTNRLFSMAFPALFPLGLADYSVRDRPRKIELYEWAKHLLRYRDSRFATHPRFRFFVLNLIFRHRAMQRGKFLFSRNISHHNMTIGQLKQALSQRDGLQLVTEIAHCLKTVKATRPYWQMEGGKLCDLIMQIGTPTFFYTLSMADMSWPDLHNLMPDNPHRPGLTPSEAAQIRYRNIANNPHIVATYLTTKHTALKDTVLQHLDIEDTARVTDFWYRVEWQARGSGKRSLRQLPIFLACQHLSGHIHGFLWLENAICVDDIDWTSSDDRRRLVDYFSRFVSTYNPNPLSARGSNDCLLRDLLDPQNRLHWDVDGDHSDLCNRCQKHGAVLNGTRQCVPSQCHKAGACRFHFLFAPSPTALAFVEHSGGKERKRSAPMRNNPWLNQHSKPVLLAWRANQDLQLVLDRTAAIHYVSKYASKPETPSDSYVQALHTFCSHLPRHLPAERAVQSLYAKMATDRDISAQEAVHLPLGEKLVDCSRSFVNLNADIDAPHILQDPCDLDDDDVAFTEPFFRHYQTRPAQFNHLNAVDYCMRFTFNPGPFQSLTSSHYLISFQGHMLQTSVSGKSQLLSGLGPGFPLRLLKTPLGLTNGHLPNCASLDHTGTTLSCWTRP